MMKCKKNEMAGQARAVTTKLNRDGNFKVMLARDPSKDDALGCYDVEYVSDGKRGTRRYITRVYVREGFPYVLTVQSEESKYNDAQEVEVLECNPLLYSASKIMVWCHISLRMMCTAGLETP